MVRDPSEPNQPDLFTPPDPEPHLAPVIKLMRSGYISQKMHDGHTAEEAQTMWDMLQSRERHPARRFNDGS